MLQHWLQRFSLGRSNRGCCGHQPEGLLTGVFLCPSYSPSPLPQMQGLLRSMAQQHQQHAPQMPAHHQYQHQQLPQYGTASLAASTSPTRGLQSSGSPIAKAVSMPERDLWLAAASLATEAEQKHHEAAAAAAAASASFSFRPPQPPTPAFGRLPLPALGGGGGSSASGGSGGLWSSTGGSGSGGAMLRSVSDLPY